MHLIPFATVAIVLIFSLATPCHVVAEDSNSIENPHLEIEKIQISGKRPNTFVKDLPTQVNVLNTDDFSAWQITNGEELAHSLANVDLRSSNPMAASMAIRGVGAENWHINTNPGVQLAIDETNVLGAYSNRLLFFDLERAEIYRGPQNGLFGINSSGGAVYLESVKPDLNTTTGYTQLKLGNDGFREIQGAINVPILAEFASRLAVYQKQRDPLWLNLFDSTRRGSIDTKGMRWHNLWQPSSKHKALFTVQYGQDEGSRTPYLGIGNWDKNGSNVVNNTILDLNAPIDCPALLPNRSASYTRSSQCVTVEPFSGNQATVAGADNWYKTYDPAADVSQVTFSHMKLNYQYSFAWGNLISISAVDRVESAYIETLSNLPSGLAFMPSQINDKRQYSQEIRLSNYNTNSQAGWTLGGYYSHAQDYYGTIITRADSGGAPFGIVPSVSIDQTAIVRSLFGLYETRIADNWLVTLNLRYSYENKYGLSTARVIAKTTDGTPSGTPTDLGAFIPRTTLESLTLVPSGPCPPNVGGFPCELATPVKQTSYLTGGNLSLRYSLSDNTQLYTQFSRGFLSGAFDTRALAAFAGTADKAVAPEIIDALELGYKSTWNNVTFNSAVFWYQWEDKQTFDVNNDGNPAFLNIPKSEIIGADAELHWIIDDQWMIKTTLGLLSSEIKDVGTLQFTQTGNQISFTPDWSTTFQLRYTWRWIAGESNFTLSHRAKDEFYTSNNNTTSSALEVSRSTNLNLQHNFEYSGWEHWQINAGVTNLTNEKTCLGMSNNGTLAYTRQCKPNSGKAQWFIGFKVDM